ncbi:MAG: phosphotransferase family protein [Acidimicrobiia bacterium]
MEHGRGLGVAGGGATSDSEGFVSALMTLGWQVRGCEGEVLRHSRFRPVFRYRVDGDDGTGRSAVSRILIGKADYRHGGASTFAFMQRLREAGLRSDGEWAIPEPIAYLDDLALLVQTEAPGRCLYEWLVTPRSPLDPARDAGRWLGHLHGTELATGDGALPSGFESRKLGGYCTELGEVLPGQAERIESITGATLAALAPLEGEGLVPTHGDYQPKNIYVDGSKVTVIDWDRGALGLPARDVGHFVGQCLTMSYSKTGSFTWGRRWNDAFLGGYAETASATEPAGLGPYVARTLLEILYYKLVVKPVSDASFVPTWLDQIDEALAA